MKQSPHSPTGSVSSCPTSPAPLHTAWRNPRLSPNSIRINTTTSNNNNNTDADFIDDDLFGSAAFKKRARAKKTSKTGHDLGDNRQVKVKVGAAAVKMVGQRVREVKGQVTTLKKWLGSLVGGASSSRSPAKGNCSAEGEDAGLAVPTADGSPTPTSQPQEELTSEVICQQARQLCGGYIHHRLIAKDELCCAAVELERLYPRVYNDVSRRIAMTMSSAQLVRRALTAVLEGTFKNGVTWGKVVSMVTISAAFAEECVVQGHVNFVEDVVMCVGHFVGLHLSTWLADHGGWASFPRAQSPVVKTSDSPPRSIAGMCLLSIVVVLVFLACFVYTV